MTAPLIAPLIPPRTGPDAWEQHPDPVILQKNAVRGWSGEQCIHRLRP